jgi:methionine-rich copper-binding protein CopC
MTAVRRGVALLLLAGLAMLLGVSPAWAHSRLEGSEPAQGTSLNAPPATVSLTFNEPVQIEFSTLTVVGPDGADYHTGDLTEVDNTVKVDVLPLGPAGTYQIGYRVVSADGHPVAGAVPFTLTAPGPGAGGSASDPGSPVAVPSSGDTGTPIWPWIVGGVVLVGGGAALALRVGRS